MARGDPHMATVQGTRLRGDMTLMHRRERMGPLKFQLYGREYALFCFTQMLMLEWLLL